MSLLTLDQLTIRFPHTPRPAVDGINLQLHAGRMLALVGESGSGKSLTALSVLGLVPATAKVHARAIKLASTNILNLPERQRRALRGGRIGTIFQEPLSALNPLHTVGKQIGEAIQLHQGLKPDAIHQRCLHLLQQVNLEGGAGMLKRYPHQLSGGQRQRVMIAMALANDPELLIADEPTTALDVTIQEAILQLLKRLQRERGLSILLISHDLNLVARFADDVAVMHDGHIVEQGPCRDVLQAPQHAYTRHLLAAEPDGTASPLPADSDVLLEARDVTVQFKLPRHSLWQRRRSFVAVDHAACTLKRGETLGIVGESGSGKSTLALALLRLLHARGQVQLLGTALDTLKGRQLRPWRKHMQVVFQDPFSSLNPRLNVAEALEEGLRVHQKHLKKAARQQKVRQMLTEVGLDETALIRYPHEFSGGQRQRIAIARALILEPDVLILDEPTSALDRSVQAQVLDLLKRLQQTYTLGYIFISHDLKLVRAISHRILVMRQGKIIESGPSETIFSQPQHAYTQELINAALHPANSATLSPM